MPLSQLPEPLPENHDDEGASVYLTETDAIHVLSSGTMRERGLLPYSSNHSFLVTVASNAGSAHAEATRGDARRAEDTLGQDEIVLPAVYKPQRGESPLWDFEWGSLCKRETAAYEISRALGWQLTPPTVLRNGTRGVGSVQLYIDHNEEDHYFTVQADARYAPAFRRMALFDYVINNADRKSGHCLIGADGQVWAIDHGVCLHTEFKLRTVIWEFSGDDISTELLEDLRRFRAQLDDATSSASLALCRLLSRDELAVLARRVDDLLYGRRYPDPDPYRRNFPWPPI